MPWAIAAPIVGGLISGAVSAAPSIAGAAMGVHGGNEAENARKKRIEEMRAQYGDVPQVDPANLSTTNSMGLTHSPFAGSWNPQALKPAPAPVASMPPSQVKKVGTLAPLKVK